MRQAERRASIVVGSEFVHIAAIANPGTKGATALYGELPMSQVLAALIKRNEEVRKAC